jgi:hypothetical protein
MTTATSASDGGATSREPTPAAALASAPGPGGEKQKISPAERWLKIREAACLRVQKRGFVGGNPFADWSEAEKEIDARYETDPEGGSSVMPPEQIAAQIKCILKAHGLGNLGIDSLLEKHQERMKKLAALDRTLIEDTTDLARRQTALAQDALHEAMSTLQSLAQGKLSSEALSKQASLSIQVMENALSHLKAMTKAVAAIAAGDKTESSRKS